MAAFPLATAGPIVEKFGRNFGWLCWILKNLGLALKYQIGACRPGRRHHPSVGGNVARQNAGSGWQTLDSTPKFTLEARPRGASPASRSRTMSGGPPGLPSSQVEYRR
jgi:hypothetical protein